MIVIGEGFLDLYLDLEMVKLGGVFHYAHVLESLKIRSKIYHISPEYMHAHLKNLDYKFTEFIKSGEVNHSPNIITVGESKETGEQNYKNVLINLKKIEININALSKITEENDNQLFIVPGSYKITELRSILQQFKGQVFIDIAYDINKEELEDLGYQFDIIFISTSSDLFVKKFNCSIQNLKNWIIPKYAKLLILKENRGGSRIFKGNEVFNIPAPITKLTHSVGVGDCYNLAFISQVQNSDYNLAGKYASKIASIYGQCTTSNEFKSKVNDLTQDDFQIEGISLPWEKRKEIQIYIAAPDFKNIDTAMIDSICSKLEYHNFKTVRPIKLLGEIGSETSQKQKREIIKNDIKLIKDSKLIIAIILYKDEGTIAEIGYASALGKPVIVYDPLKLIDNTFIENISKKMIYSINDLINEVFILMNKLE